MRSTKRGVRLLWVSLSALFLLTVSANIDLRASGSGGGRTFEECIQACDSFNTRCVDSCPSICQRLFPNKPSQRAVCISTCTQICNHIDDECREDCEHLRPPPTPEDP